MSDGSRDEVGAEPHDALDVAGEVTSEVDAPGGPKRDAKGPRAVRGPGTGLVASLALVVLLVAVIGWTRC